MYNIHTHHIVFKLCMMENERRKTMNKIEIFMFGFLNFEGLAELIEWI